MANYLDETGLARLWTHTTDINKTLPKNAGAHNSIYRGKDITSKLTDGTLYTAISAGTFDDVFVGDYFTASTKLLTGSTSTVTYRVMGLDLRLYKGGSALSTHHAVIMPDTTLGSAQMNTTSTTSGGYAGSAMYTTTIPTIDTNLTSIFGTHLISHYEYFSNAVDTSTNWISSTTSVRCKAWLLDEPEVYGCYIMAQSGNTAVNYTYGYGQLPAFSLNPSLVSKSRNSWWLRSVRSGSQFCFVSNGGLAASDYALYSYGVRPAFLID